MSEIGDTFKALRQDRQGRGLERRSLASSDFEEAEKLARSLGFNLLRRSDTHYQIEPVSRAWLINLYPGNGRIMRDRGRGPAPFLRVPAPWSLLDVVEAAKLFA